MGKHEREYPTRVTDEKEKKTSDLYVVRLYDGFDNLWIDITDPITKENAEKVLAKKTDNGKKNTCYDDIDYYWIFPANTKMKFM